MTSLDVLSSYARFVGLCGMREILFLPMLIAAINGIPCSSPRRNIFPLKTRHLIHHNSEQDFSIDSISPIVL